MSRPSAIVALSALAALWASTPTAFAQQLPDPSTVPRSPPLVRPAVPTSPVRPPVTIKCAGGRNYSLTTGSSTGLCKVYVDQGRIVGGFCTDGSNTVRQTCSTGCIEMTGTGTCEMEDPTKAGTSPPGR